MRHLRKRAGQSTLEYAILIAVVISGLIIMQGYIKRGVQGRLRASTDDIGEQFTPGSLEGDLVITTNREANEVTSGGATTTTITEHSQTTTGAVDMNKGLADDIWPE